MTLRTDAALDEALTDLAALEGVSRQEVIRRAVLDRHAKHSHGNRVRESASRLVEEWGDVLERLGTV